LNEGANHLERIKMPVAKAKPHARRLLRAMRTETERSLELAERDIVAALENLCSSHVADNLHRLGVLDKGDVEMATTILAGRLKMMRHHLSNARTEQTEQPEATAFGGRIGGKL
jgi:hypothetical protein